MSNIVKVGRLHLVDRFGYTWLVWGVLRSPSWSTLRSSR
jgi:hypothetical protein